MRTAENYCTFVKREVAYPDKSMRHNPKRSKARFLPEQRKTLFLAWERGFLCDNKNYGSLSEITGLTRKQISNWARTQINKCNEADHPQKNCAPLRTIFRELSDCMLTDSGTIPRCHLKSEAQDYKPQNLNFEPRDYKPQYIKFEAQNHETLRPNCEPKYFKKEVLSSSLDLPPQPHQYGFQYISPGSIRKVSKVHPISLKFFPQHSEGLALTPQFSLDTKTTSTSTVVPRTGSGESILTSCTSSVSESYRNLRQTSANNISSMNQWVLQNALKGIKKVDDEKIEILSILVSTNHLDIIFYLVNNGWQPKEAKRGIHYVRTKPI